MIGFTLKMNSPYYSNYMCISKLNLFGFHCICLHMHERSPLARLT